MRDQLRVLARRHPFFRALAEFRRRFKARIADHSTRHMTDPIQRAGQTGCFDSEDIDEVARVVFDEGHASPRYANLEHAHMRLPDWYRPDLDPYGPEYLEQQKRLWRLVAGVDRDYEAQLDEKEAPIPDGDTVRFPGFFLRRDADAVRSASDHVLACGMILKHSGVRPGGWALEYGAGFGHTALTLARLGVHVDTVDISRAFCDQVQRQANHFQVPLTAHVGHFGHNPRPGHRYDLIFFYESFHHCLDWQDLLAKLPSMLTEEGRVLLCGEPMAERAYAAVPYPWGVRLQSDVVATVRRLHWFELGFTEDFLYEIFNRAGFSIERYRCEPSLWGRTYVCQQAPSELHLGRTWLPPALLDEGWHEGEEDGRWTRGPARLALPQAPGLSGYELELSNPSPAPIEVGLSAGDWLAQATLAPGEQRSWSLPANGAPWLHIVSKGRRLGGWRRWLRPDDRLLGVFARRLRSLRSSPPA